MLQARLPFTFRTQSEILRTQEPLGAEGNAHSEREEGRERRHLLRLGEEQVPEMLTTDEDKPAIG